MHKIRILAAAIFLAAFSSSAMGDIFNLQSGDSRSAFRDLSNIWYSECAYGINMDASQASAPIYINSINITTKTWNAGLNLKTPSVDFLYQDNNNNGATSTYTLGSAIATDANWDFKGAFLPNANVDPTVPDGIYTATLDILGGNDSTKHDSLASFNLTLQVLQKLDITVTNTLTPDSIAQGQMSKLAMTVTNNMTGHDYVATGWFTSDFTDGAGNYLQGDFDYTDPWSGKTISPGQSTTGAHSTWTAAVDQVLGTYYANEGVTGGLYNGDWYLVNNSPKATLTVTKGTAPVPEPAFVQLGAMLCLGGFGMLKRRRKA